MSALGIVPVADGIWVREAGNLPAPLPWFLVFPHRPAFRGGGAGRWGNTRNHSDPVIPQGDKTKGASNARPPTRKNH
jgi:hypothetical protein